MTRAPGYLCARAGDLPQWNCAQYKSALFLFSLPFLFPTPEQDTLARQASSCRAESAVSWFESGPAGKLNQREASPPVWCQAFTVVSTKQAAAGVQQTKMGCTRTFWPGGSICEVHHDDQNRATREWLERGEGNREEGNQSVISQLSGTVETRDGRLRYLVVSFLVDSMCRS